ncbi:MAG: acetate--CoA ligase family protein [Alphaproteobacteria bacterium]|nr:acetate--CoA ligase family protein [Alphaproteobacteria bacterium]
MTHSIAKSQESLRALLAPRSIAIIGASPTEGSFGQRLVRAITSGNYAGKVYRVNPRYQSLDGAPCHPSLAALPEKPDCVAFAISDERVEAGLVEAAKAGIRGAAIFGRCYEKSTGSNVTLPARLGSIAREAGMAVCGSNCMGFVNVTAGLRVSGNPPPISDPPGGVALISHSGSTWSGLVGNQRQLRFNYAISAGQEIATGAADYIRYMLEQPETRVIACILETVRAPDDFVAAVAEAERRGIPVVVLKLGRSEQGRRFALAHSGALCGSDAAFGAVLRRHNVVEVRSVDELTDTIEMMQSPRRPAAGGIGAVTDSGGERELIVDLAADLGAPLAELTPPTMARLTEVLDPGMTPVNPVDSFGDGRTLIEECLKIIVDDPNVGIAALATNLVHGRPYVKVASATVERVAAGTAKPAVLFGHIHSAVSREEAARLRALGIPVLMGTPTALQAMSHFLGWHARRADKDREAGPMPAPIGAMLPAWRARLERQNAALSPQDAEQLLRDAGIATAPSAFASTLDEAKSAAGRLGYPVALKTAAANLLHKTEADGVKIGLADDAGLRAAYDEIARRCGPLVQVQRMADAGTEVLLGMVNDPQFGPIATLGVGGIFAEVYKDTVPFVPPIGPAMALRLLGSLKGYALLTGARGRPKADLDALAQVVSRFSWLCAAVGPLLSELDVNPVIASPRGAVAVDALVVPLSAAKPDSHTKDQP